MTEVIQIPPKGKKGQKKKRKEKNRRKIKEKIQGEKLIECPATTWLMPYIAYHNLNQLLKERQHKRLLSHNSKRKDTFKTQVHDINSRLFHQ